MKIESVKIKNFKGIEHFEGDINGANVYLIGKNGSGKSSFIDAIFCGLSGKNIPPQPVTKGNKKGEVQIDLGDFIATTKFVKDKPAQLILENKVYKDKKDQFIASPRAYLNSRVGILDFNLNEFFGKSAQEQVKYFCKVSGIDFSDLDADIEEIEESRKADKKELVIAQTKTGFFDKKEAEKEIVSVVAESQKITAEKAKAEQYERIVKGKEEREKRIEEINATIKALELERDGGEYVDASGAVIPVDGLTGQVQRANDWLIDPDNIGLTTAELEKLETDFANLEETNRKIQEAKDFKLADEKVDKLQKAIEQANDDILAKKTEKAKRISENINIEGLEYSIEDELFLYDGLPFDANQNNTASQMIAGIKIASMMLKDLKILRLDASLIDKREFDKVLEWSEKNDIELFIELVDREGGELQIVIDEQ